jgi:hypothetical protein
MYDKRQGAKTPKWVNRDDVPGIKLDAATYIGIVKSNYDSMRSGRLQVWIPDFGGFETDSQNWRTVSYASPFFGAVTHQNKNASNTIEHVPHTYGFWAVPPDINSQVLCTFVNGDPNRGYWFACVNNVYGSYMTPGLAAGNDVDETPADAKTSIDLNSLTTGQSLPVTEFNQHTPGFFSDTFFNNPKPIHGYQANILFQQGLDRDPIRGATTSSSQRESPSQVFGMSTPGRPVPDPADDPTFQSRLEQGKLTKADFEVKARKGGHSLVMDDGDQLGYDRLTRLKSSGGHQILMNDTEDIFYICNSTGSVWIELGESGHMHIYTSGGFNVRTQGEFNLQADKDINIQTDGKMKILVKDKFNIEAKNFVLNAIQDATLYGGVSAEFGSSGPVAIAGSVVNINNGAAPPPDALKPLSHNDTTYKTDKHLWFTVPGYKKSIVTIMPAHEPWPRAVGLTASGLPVSATQSNVPPGNGSGGAAGGPNPITGGPPTQTLPPNVCPPIAGSSVENYTLPPPNNNNLDHGKVHYQPYPWSTDQPFLNKVKSVAAVLNANYLDLLAIMYNESAGTFDPSITNSIGATGMIQFIRSTAIGLGTTTTALAAMSRVEQMDWVLKYFQRNGIGTKTTTPGIQDLYCAVFWPAAVGKPDNNIIAGQNGPYSNVWNQNPGLRSANRTGPITNASVGAGAAQWLNRVKQTLANAGATNSSGSLKSGSGGTVTDGSGNAVKVANPGGTNTSTTTTDAGITKAAGQSVGATCSIEYLSSTAVYTPPDGIGSTPKLDQGQVKAMCAELGYFESQNTYNKISSDTTRIGKYQVDAAYLAARGYIKPDALTQYTTQTLSKSASWTGQNGINSMADFLNNTGLQDQIQYQEFVSDYTQLLANGGIKSSDDICKAAGMMFVAHQFRSADLAKSWRSTGVQNDVYNRNGAVYFNQGRYAIDVLSANEASAAASTAAATGG